MRSLPVLLALLTYVAGANGQKLPCDILTSKPYWAAYTVCPVDANCDSTDELFVLNSYSAHVEQAPESFVWFRPSPVEQGARCHSWAADVTGDGAPEIILTETVRESIWVHVIDARSGTGNRYFVASRQPYHGSHHDYDVACAAFVDLDADGANEIILATISGYEPGVGSRALYAVDARTGVRLWRFGMGPKANRIIAEDVDGNERVELFVSTASTSNGCTENGTSDSSTYVISLDASGRQSWTKEFRHRTGGGTTIALARGPRTGAPVLVVADECSFVGSAADSIKILDARTGTWLRSVPADGIAGRFFVTDLDGDGAREVVTSEGSKVVIRDLTLRVRHRVELGFAPVKLALCGQLLGRRSMELAVTAGGGQLLILDGRLRTDGRRDLEGRAIVAEGVLLRNRGVGRPVALVTRLFAPWGPNDSTAEEGDVFREMQIALNPRMFPWAWLTAGLAGLLLCAGVSVAVMRRSYREQMTTIVRGLTGQAGILEVDGRGRMRHTNPKARELLGGESLPAGPLAQAVRAALSDPPGSTPRELPVALDGGRTVFARVARVRSGVMLTLEDVSAVEYLQRVRAWAPVAQKLAHGIKNPLGTIMGAVEQIETKVDDDRVKKYVGYVKDEVTRLKKMTDAFMRFTKLDPPELQPRNINELVRKVVAKYEGALAKGISRELSLDDRLPLLALDEEGIANVLDIVLENGIEAMSGEAGSRQNVEDRGLKIRTRVLDSPHGGSLGMTEGSAASPTQTGLGVLGGLGDSYVRIEIADTGIGIPQKYLDKVFEPYFTHGKPDGTGLGLALAKKIVEDHKGRMEIESKEGVGTTVAIVLPAKGNGE